VDWCGVPAPLVVGLGGRLDIVEMRCDEMKLGVNGGCDRCVRGRS
jgi:hypothetical protein